MADAHDKSMSWKEIGDLLRDLKHVRDGGSGRAYPGEPMWSVPVSQGCICPPTSEQTCQNPQCPRQAVKG
jgi:hypothetical protein